VLIAYDGSPSAATAVRAGAGLLPTAQACVVTVPETSVHAATEFPKLPESDEGAWRAVAAAARTHGASVIATGTRGLGAARSALVGSVSSGLIQNAELPILVVPDEPAAAAAREDG
jgi:hypothetical protein